MRRGIVWLLVGVLLLLAVIGAGVYHHETTGVHALRAGMTHEEAMTVLSKDGLYADKPSDWHEWTFTPIGVGDKRSRGPVVTVHFGDDNRVTSWEVNRGQDK
jgi:hypothetical protein